MSIQLLIVNYELFDFENAISIQKEGWSIVELEPNFPFEIYSSKEAYSLDGDP